MAQAACTSEYEIMVYDINKETKANKRTPKAGNEGQIWSPNWSIWSQAM
jgi:hypothetical protein